MNAASKIAFGLTVLFAPLAFAQSPKTDTLMDHKLSCADFKHNADGSWSPLHPVTIGGATMGSGASFNPGAVMGGIDLAVLLNKECAKT